MPTAADRQLRRECEQALRSDSSSVDAQLGALAAHPLAVEMAHVGEQGRRVRRFWLPRGLSASVEELEVEAGCQVDTARPAASANWLSGGLLQHRSTLQARSLPRASASLGQSARHRGRGFDMYRRASLTVAASIAYGCSLPHSRLQEGSLGHCVWEASVALSIFLATDAQESVRGRRVLELGAGCGLAGITTATLNPARALSLSLSLTLTSTPNANPTYSNPNPSPTLALALTLARHHREPGRCGVGYSHRESRGATLAVGGSELVVVVRGQC